MNTSYQYTTTASWTTGRAGVVKADSLDLPITFSAPPEFHGRAGLWTPEHFLVAAVAGCFITTFIAIAELSKFELETLEVSVQGSLEKGEGGFQFTRMTIRPVLTIAQDSERERALRLLEKAERSCLVSRSLRSDVVVKPTVLVQAPVSAT